MNTNGPWKPNDWLKLIALIGAFCLFGVGSVMLFRGISAEGIVDLRSTLLSGTLKASSAGLYICFFPLFIIIFVLVALITPAREGAPKVKGRVRRLLWIFWGLLLGLIGCGLGAAFLPQGFRFVAGALVGFFGFSLSSVVAAIIRLVNEDNA